MSECGGPIGVAGHEQDVDNDSDDQSGEGDPDGKVGLFGEFVPHIYVEKHSENHVGEEHDGDYADAAAEVLPEDEGEDVDVEDDAEEDQAAECCEVVHYFGVEGDRAFFFRALEEERLGCIPEHLYEQVHNDG